jgi:dTMP kinase
VAPGKLIVYEGPEGAGKTTQIGMLATWLGAQGTEVVVLREPGGTLVGDEVRRILLDPASDITPHAEALLFMASRAQLVEQKIEPALTRGVVVLLDRFFLSTYAYQGAGRGLAEEEIRNANRLATRGRVPDITVLLRVTVAEGLGRAGQRGPRDRMERADRAFHERVSEAFTRFAADEWQSAHPECGPIATIDGSGTAQEVFARALAVLRSRWPASFPDA